MVSGRDKRKKGWQARCATQVFNQVKINCLNSCMKNNLQRHGPQLDSIKLPDGRTYSVTELLKSRGRSRTRNIRTGREYDPLAPRHYRQHQNDVDFSAPNVKYSLEDRLWQCEHTAEEIQDRYNILTLDKAKQIRYKALSIVNYLRTRGVV